MCYLLFWETREERGRITKVGPQDIWQLKKGCGKSRLPASSERVYGPACTARVAESRLFPFSAAEVFAHQHPLLSSSHVEILSWKVRSVSAFGIVSFAIPFGPWLDIKILPQV